MVRIALLFACFTTLLVLIQFTGTSYGKQIPHCDPSSCGNVRNISTPFRLTTDPKHCGNRRYELSCENNLTLLYLYSQKYYVVSINYNNFTIRLVDPGVQKGNCSSIPQHSLAANSFNYLDPFTVYTHKQFPLQIVKPVIFISCAKPAISPLLLDTAPCIKKGYTFRHSYVRVGRGLNASDVGDLCSIDIMAMTSSLMVKEDHYNQQNLSFSEIHSALAYGFEVSWFKCANCTGYCYYDPVFNCLGTVRKISCTALTTSKFLCGQQLLQDLYNTYSSILTLVTLLIGLNLVARILCGFPITFIFLIYKLRRRHWSAFDDIEGYLQSQNNLKPIRYSYSEIKKMTKGFKNKLGEGGYGSVYKGKLRSGQLVAIKILGKSKSNGQDFDFINEVATIGRIHHVNVVQLIGYCVERSKRALVYDFMPNGSLEKHLFSREERVGLSWERKYEIALGVARGIEYLHQGCDMQILHFDIKPHNILLDDNFIPKVSDFGLARLYPTDNSIVSLTAARGTIGYVAPELINRSLGGISYKADVYSFGMLLVEMVGLKKNLATTEENSSQYFPYWIYDKFNKGKEIIEMDDVTDDKRKITRKMSLVALWCIQTNPVSRPSMTKVVEMLEGEVELLQVPPEPFQSPQYASIEDQTWSGDSTESIALLCDPSLVTD